MQALIIAVVVIASVSGVAFFLMQDFSKEYGLDETEGGLSAPIEAAKDVKERIESRNAIELTKRLDLSGQGLTKVPANVFERTDLIELDLSSNVLTGSLQAEIRHLQKLKVLDLSDNQMTGVPAEIGQLSNLEELDLSNNQLTGLPYELGNLSNLVLLDLRGNNYAEADLARIKASLPSTVVIQVD